MILMSILKQIVEVEWSNRFQCSPQIHVGGNAWSWRLKKSLRNGGRPFQLIGRRSRVYHPNPKLRWHKNLEFIATYGRLCSLSCTYERFILTFHIFSCYFHPISCYFILPETWRRRVLIKSKKNYYCRKVGKIVTAWRASRFD